MIPTKRIKVKRWVRMMINQHKVDAAARRRKMNRSYGEDVEGSVVVVVLLIIVLVALALAFFIS